MCLLSMGEEFCGLVLLMRVCFVGVRIGKRGKRLGGVMVLLWLKRGWLFIEFIDKIVFR